VGKNHGIKTCIHFRNSSISEGRKRSLVSRGWLVKKKPYFTLVSSGIINIFTVEPWPYGGFYKHR